MPRSKYIANKLQKMHTINEIWLYLHFPQLALDAQLDQFTAQIVDQPYAIVVQSRQLQRIYCCNEAAKKDGIEEQMSLSTALALCPQLQSRTRNIPRETDYLEQLALAAYNFSPVVVLYEKIGIGLELSRCEKLYGDYVTLLQQLHAQIKKRCTHVTSGVGPSLQAARLTDMSKFHTDIPNNKQISLKLHAIPVDKIVIKKSQQRSCEQLGLNTLGDLLALPRSSISRRFGHEIISQVDQLTGTLVKPQIAYTPAEYFSDQLHNPNGIYTKEGLYVPMKNLLQRLCGYLGARHFYCRKLRWQFSPLIGEPQSMHVNLSTGNNNYMSFFTLSRLQLDGLQLAHSIETITLYSDHFIPAPAGNLDFFNDQKRVDKNQLLDQLTAKLGSDALSQPGIQAEYLPEHANSKTGLSSAKGLNKQAFSHQPLWLMEHPIALSGHRQRPFWRQPLTLLSGPERLSDNWWSSEQQRDYYLAHDPQGSRYWLFWEKSSQRWFVQGLFS